MTRDRGQGLGRDFWLYRVGQMVSLLGDSCSYIALSWWILDKTGSAGAMSAVLAPPMIVRLILMPLMGPVADRFDRKKLIFVSNIWRFFMSAFLVGMVVGEYFNLPIITLVFALNSIGSALFNATASGIVPLLVRREQMEVASRHAQSINAIASILGGVLGGVLVSFAGVVGGFMFDVVSYAVAAFTNILMRQNLKPREGDDAFAKFSTQIWWQDFKEGFSLVLSNPLLKGVCLIAMFLNLVTSPIGVLLPILAKEARQMPPWFLGALESSVGLGSILGAFSLSFVKSKVKASRLMVLSISMMGCGFGLLPLLPNLALPLGVLFGIGLGQTWFNIPLMTQVQLMIPGHLLGRIFSIINFLAMGIAPLGVAFSGLLVEKLGLTPTLVGIGILMVLLAPLLMFIPKMAAFLLATPEQARTFFKDHFPGSRLG